MIEITCYPCGSTAEADTPEAALLAARTLCADDAEHMNIRGRDRHVVFTFEDSHAWSARERDLWR